MPPPGQRNAASHARPEADFAHPRESLQRLGGVSDNVEKRLRELFGIRLELRQADVEIGMDENLRELGLKNAADSHQELVDVRSPEFRQAVRRQEPIYQRLQTVRLADDHLRVLDQRRTIELVFEQLRGAANAAQWILDLVREAAYQVPIGLLLFQQAFLARDLELLIDVSKFQDHHRPGGIDHRYRAGKMQLELAGDAELELLLGVGSAARKRFVDGLKKRRRFTKNGSGGMSDPLALGELEQVLGGWIRIGDAELVGKQYNRGGKQFQARIRGGIRFDGGKVRLEHRVPPKRCDDSSKFRARTAWVRAGESKAYRPDPRRSSAIHFPLTPLPTVRIEAVPARATEVLLQRRQLLAQGFDILLVKADCLPQFGEPVGVFLGILLLVGQRRWRAIAVGRACVDEKLFFGVELIGQNLAPQPVAPALRIRVDSGKSGRG